MKSRLELADNVTIMDDMKSTMRDVLSGCMTKNDWKKLPSVTTEIIESYERRRESLAKQQADLDNQIRRLDNYVYNEIAQIASQSDSELVRSYGEALLHQQCGVKPKTKKLGYIIADTTTKRLPVKFKMLVELICCMFDMTSYVFCNTRYDERDGDHFFRRS